VSWSWDAEASEASDDAPTFAQPAVDIFEAAWFVPISIEAFQDAANVTQTVGVLSLRAATFSNRLRSRWVRRPVSRLESSPLSRLRLVRS